VSSLGNDEQRTLQKIGETPSVGLILDSCADADAQTLPQAQEGKDKSIKAKSVQWKT